MLVNKDLQKRLDDFRDAVDHLSQAKSLIILNRHSDRELAWFLQVEGLMRSIDHYLVSEYGREEPLPNEENSNA